MKYEKQINRVIKTEVLVIGGGAAGFGAAVAAARNGAETLLIEQAEMLGGMATAGLVGPFMTCYNDAPTEQIVKGIFDELCVRTEEKGGAIHPSKVEGLSTYSSYYVKSHCHVTPFLSETLAIVMEDMVLEAGAKILYHVQLCDVLSENGRITGVIAAMKEGLTRIEASVYIDCTGDADVAYYAGAECISGDETDGVMQPVTLFFEVGNIDREKFVGALEEKKAEGRLGIPGENCWSWFIKEAKEKGEWTIDRNEIGNYEQPIEGRWKINTTRIAHIDATNTEEITRAMIAVSYTHLVCSGNNWEPTLMRAMEDMTEYNDGGKTLPNVYLIFGKRILDLSGLLDEPQVQSLAKVELASAREEDVLIILCSARTD